MTIIQEIADDLSKGNSKKIVFSIKKAIDEGYDPNEILNLGMIDAMEIIGEKFQKNEIFVPEMLIAAKAMKKGVAALKPYLPSDYIDTSSKLVIGTVAGDLHDIGKNLVSVMLESSGFEIIDLGVDVPAEKFVEAVKENSDVRIVALSALLTTTMPALEKTVNILRKMDERNTFKIFVGGAPINQAFADEIGADGYASNAASAATKAKELIA